MLPKTSLVRKAIEKLYDGKATVLTYPDNDIDPSTGIVSISEEKSDVYPCRLSYKTIQNASISDGLATFDQSVTLFIAPEINIPSGSDIDIEHRGRILHFTSAGVPAVYDTHQEIPLKHRGKYNG